jgi:hypothetical protein
VIYNHLDFDWRATLSALEQFVERNDGSARPSTND